jgi:hypothetical protein
VYASATDIRPDTVFKLDIVHSETDRRVLEMQGPPPDGTNPTTICDFWFGLKDVESPEPGPYYIRFFGNGHLLLQRPFEVAKPEPKG